MYKAPWSIVLRVHGSVINKANLSASYLFRASEIELAGSNMAVGPYLVAFAMNN